MWINPFWVGVLAAIMAFVVVLIVIGVAAYLKEKKAGGKDDK